MILRQPVVCLFGGGGRGSEPILKGDNCEIMCEEADGFVWGFCAKEEVLKKQAAVPGGKIPPVNPDPWNS